MDKLPQKLIYVIDDDEDDFQILKDTIITRWPTLAIEYYSDSEIFINNLGSLHRPGLIVLDVNMPKLNGLEVITVLKKNYFWNIVPVIFLSTSMVHKEDALKLGAHNYLVKPSTVEQWAEVAESIRNAHIIHIENLRAFG